MDLPRRRPEDPAARPTSWTGRAVEWAARHFLCFATVLALLVYGVAYLGDCFGPPIRSDGVGYYAYLPANLLQGDPSMETLAKSQYGGTIPTWTGIEIYPPTGRYLDRYNAGVALLMAPFFLAAHLLTMLCQSPVEWQKLNFPADGYSFFYQHGAGLAGVYYMLLGLFLLKRALEKTFAPRVVFFTLITLLLGTNLLHYGSGESVMSHAYSFCLFSGLLLVIPRWYAEPEKRRWSIWLGLLAGLIPLVRLPNVIILLLWPLYNLSATRAIPGRLLLIRSRWVDVLRIGLIALAVFSPQLWIWKSATGNWWVDSYAAQGHIFVFARPQLWNVLFSMQKGLFFWAPALLLCLPGWWLLRKRAPEFWMASALYMALHIYLVAAWVQWWFGGSFGHRAFVESLAVLAFPLAAVYAASATARARWLVAGFSVACVLYSLFFMLLYYTREISFHGLDRQALFDLFWWRKEAFLLWLTGPG